MKKSVPALLCAALTFAIIGVGAAPAVAAVPALTVQVLGDPTNLPPGGESKLLVRVTNLGDAPAVGETTPIVIADKLPARLTATAITGATVGREATCELTTLRCEYTSTLNPYQGIQMAITVKAAPGASATVIDEGSVSGGGAPGAVAREPVRVSGTPAGFGVESLRLVPTNEDGSIDTQAGSHPFELTTTLELNSALGLNPDFPGEDAPTGLVKDLHFNLPAGLIGNPEVVPQCTPQQFDELLGEGFNGCPSDTAVGVAMPELYAIEQAQGEPVPLFNLVPSVGEPARFGFEVAHIPVILDTSVRTGGDYGVVVSVTNISQAVQFFGSKVTFWGVPEDPRHNSVRGWNCLFDDVFKYELPCEAPVNPHPAPLLTLPTACSGDPLQTSVQADSWEEPLNVLLFSNTAPIATLDGCNRLPFEPSIKATPDGTAASTPTGLNVDTHVNQGSVVCGTCLAQSAVKEISVALPEDFAVNPAGGDGLQACSERLVGYEPPPVSEPPENLHFTPSLPEPFEPGVNFCPDASKIGEVTIKSPLLPPGQFLKGFVYLATQNANPFGSLLALYVVARDPISGVLVKLPGETHLTPSGQVIGTFKNTPQLAFEDAELHFFGGERAPLSSPAHCGAYTTNASFTPWSGNGPVNASSTFNITSGPHGSPCPGASLPFSPSLTGGTTNINAGSFTPLTTTIGREDGHQDLGSVQLHMPAGLEGLLSGVKLCPEEQANEGTCGPESQIGETTVSAGVGSDPVSVKGGRVYITEKYAGAPFGLSIVNPVKAGPFDLEHDTSNPAQNPACDCVVVRAKIDVDPHTADLTITTDPSGAHAIPHLIDGIPVQIQKVNVLINRPNFTFNPTNCSPLTITGAIVSDEGASSPVSFPFRVTNCATLKFAPKFEVSTSGQTSKAKGASLSVKLSYPSAPFGSEANIASVKVELPKQLPSRLTTLQKACTAAQFAANPAGCPSASVVGHAVVHTPLLPVPLEGPAYFVSNGGEAFPNLIMVLQGYGVTVELVGDTFINKQGVTSSTFKATPDVPFSTFELTLPEGRFSALAANANLCAPTKSVKVRRRVAVRRRGRTVHLVRSMRQLIPEPLEMPTTITGQNGAQIHQSTPIEVTGCTKAKHRRAHKKHGGKHQRRGKR
jgi:hypothetical protein